MGLGLSSFQAGWQVLSGFPIWQYGWPQNSHRRPNVLAQSSWGPDHHFVAEKSTYCAGCIGCLSQAHAHDLPRTLVACNACHAGSAATIKRLLSQDRPISNSIKSYTKTSWIGYVTPFFFYSILLSYYFIPLVWHGSTILFAGHRFNTILLLYLSGLALAKYKILYIKHSMNGVRIRIIYNQDNLINNWIEDGGTYDLKQCLVLILYELTNWSKTL